MPAQQPTLRVVVDSQLLTPPDGYLRYQQRADMAGNRRQRYPRIAGLLFRSVRRGGWLPLLLQTVGRKRHQHADGRGRCRA